MLFIIIIFNRAQHRFYQGPAKQITKPKVSIASGPGPLAWSSPEKMIQTRVFILSSINWVAYENSKAKVLEVTSILLPDFESSSYGGGRNWLTVETRRLI